MKIRHWLLGALLICGSQAVSADCYSNDCDPCYDDCNSCFDFCDCDYTVYADYLYWKPCRSDLDDGATSGASYLNPGYESGFRVGAFAQCDCMDFGFRYTWLYTDDEFFSNDQTTIYRLDDYQVLDLELGFTLPFDCCDFSLRPYAGARFAWIDEKFNIGPDHYLVEFWGGGLYTGFEWKYHVTDIDGCGCNYPVYLIGHADVGVLDGHFEVKTTSPRNEECTCVVTTNLFAGAEVLLEDVLCGSDAFVQIGYEFQNYSNWRRHNDAHNLASLGVSGLVVRGGLSF